MPTMTTPGNALNYDIIALLKSTGRVALVWRQNSGIFKVRGAMYTAGYKFCGDVIGMFDDGRHFQFEGKAENDRASQGQIDNANWINAHGGLAAIIHSIDELRDLLIDEGYLK